MKGFIDEVSFEGSGWTIVECYHFVDLVVEIFFEKRGTSKKIELSF